MERDRVGAQIAAYPVGRVGRSQKHSNSCCHELTATEGDGVQFIGRFRILDRPANTIRGCQDSASANGDEIAVPVSDTTKFDWGARVRDGPGDGIG